MCRVETREEGIDTTRPLESVMVRLSEEDGSEL
jgi:hypothetical protein